MRSTPSVEGAWHWVDSKELHYRPKEYWPAHSTIKVQSRLKGLKIRNGLYGDKGKSLKLKTGSRLEALADASGLSMKVRKDGKVIKEIPITTGKAGFETRNGTKVILGRESFVRMRSGSVGIGGGESYDLGVHWATRLTWSGEYVHAAPWSSGSHGVSNSSHGCTGMSTENAQWFFEHVRPGVPVTHVNSDGDEMAPFGNGFGDWNLSWKKWKEGSATDSGAQDGGGRRPRSAGSVPRSEGVRSAVRPERPGEEAERRTEGTAGRDAQRGWTCVGAPSPSRSSPARAPARATGSIGCETAASARLQDASQASWGRPISSSTGGQSKISSLICRHTPMPPAGAVSPSSTHTSMRCFSRVDRTAGRVAHSTYSTAGTSEAGRRPAASRTCSRVLESSL